MHVPLVASWPAAISIPTVCSDLVDTTDFLPTLLDAAKVPPLAGLTLDGRSFLPQLRGQKGQPREWVYSWYSPRLLPDTSMTARECAFDHRYKLYRTGEFYDLDKDLREEQPLKVASLEGPAAVAAKRLGAALDQFATVRPPEPDRVFERAIQEQGKQKKKRKKSSGLDSVPQTI